MLGSGVQKVELLQDVSEVTEKDILVISESTAREITVLGESNGPHSARTLDDGTNWGVC